MITSRKRLLRHRKHLAPAGLIGFCLALAQILPAAGWVSRLELRSLDYRFAARDRWFSVRESGEEDIVVVAIDARSIDAIEEPFLLWDRHFTRVFSALTDAGAKVIAADVIWLKSVEDYLAIPGASARADMVRAMRRAALEGRLVLAALGEAGPDAGRSRQSLGRHAFLLGTQVLALAQPQPDADGVIRRQAARHRTIMESGVERRAPSFPFLIAERFRGSVPGLPERTVLIDYRAAAPPYRLVSFQEVLALAAAGDRGALRAAFSGKIALIGTTWRVQDTHPSPLGQDTPGVLVHAFAVDSFLSAHPLRELGGGRLLSASLTLVAAAACLSLPWGAAALLSAAVLGSYLGLAQILFQNQLVIPAAGPIVSAAIGALAAMLYRYAVADRDKRRIARVLRSYVNPKVAEEALRESDSGGILRGRRRQVAVLFSDVRGFTRMSEGLPPEQVVRFLNEYLTAMSDIILDGNGTIDKFVGDGIMAFFGAPVPEPNPSLQAMRVALDMQDKVVSLNRRWKSAGLPEIRIGIGIHFGEAVVGTIGSRRKMDYTAIGDTTNTASRIEGLTKDYKTPILISRRAYEEAKDSIVAEPLGRAAIRGRSAMELFALRGLRERGAIDAA